jgi:hypothetical protein
MTRIEQFEMTAHQPQLVADVKRLVEKYRAIFDWDVPDVDEAFSNRLIIQALRQALDDIEQTARSAEAR